MGNLYRLQHPTWKHLIIDWAPIKPKITWWLFGQGKTRKTQINRFWADEKMMDFTPIRVDWNSHFKNQLYKSIGLYCSRLDVEFMQCRIVTIYIKFFCATKWSYRLNPSYIDHIYNILGVIILPPCFQFSRFRFFLPSFFPELLAPPPPPSSKVTGHKCLAAAVMTTRPITALPV